MLRLKKIDIFSLLLPAVLLSACSDNPTSVAKKILEARVGKESGDTLAMTDFKKIDAEDLEFAGQKHYRLQYTIEVKCVKPGWINTSGKDGIHIYNFAVYNEECNYIPGYYFAGAEIPKECRDKQMNIGDHFTYNGRMELSKHESGWVEDK